MKTRILSSLVGLVLLTTILFFYDKYIFNLVVSIISVLVVYELFMSTKYVTNKTLCIISFAFVSLVPFFNMKGFSFSLKLICFIFLLALLIIQLIRHNTLKFEQVSLVFMISIMVPFAFSAFIYIREIYPRDTIYYFLLIFAGAWLTDSGAYFVGTFFGKNKLCPSISPKKTVEGAIGGIIGAIIGFFIITQIHVSIWAANGEIVKVNYPYLVIIAVMAAIIGMLGDLFASIIKRQCSIKDFGNIMPGHGGVLDRVDSLIVVAPFMYFMLQILPILTRK